MLMKCRLELGRGRGKPGRDFQCSAMAVNSHLPLASGAQAWGSTVHVFLINAVMLAQLLQPSTKSHSTFLGCSINKKNINEKLIFLMVHFTLKSTYVKISVVFLSPLKP